MYFNFSFNLFYIVLLSFMKATHRKNFTYEKRRVSNILQLISTICIYKVTLGQPHGILKKSIFFLRLVFYPSYITSILLTV
jgi:hypothetical protein